MGRTTAAVRRRTIQFWKKRLAAGAQKQKKLWYTGKRVVRRFWQKKGSVLLYLVFWSVAGIGAAATVLPGRLAPFGIALVIGAAQSALLPLTVGAIIGSLLVFSGLWALRQLLAIGFIFLARILLGRQAAPWAGLVGVLLSGVLSQRMAAMGEGQSGTLFWLAQGCLALGLGWFLQQAAQCCLWDIPPALSPDEERHSFAAGLPDPLTMLCLLSVWFTVCCTATGLSGLLCGSLQGGNGFPAGETLQNALLFLALQSFAALILGTLHREELLGIFWSAGVLAAVTTGVGVAVLPAILLASWCATHLPLQRLGQGVVFLLISLLTFFTVETLHQFGQVLAAMGLAAVGFWLVSARQLLHWEDILLRQLWMPEQQLWQNPLAGLQLLAGGLQAVAGSMQACERHPQPAEATEDPVELACEQICSGCAQKAACWGGGYTDTRRAMQQCLESWRENCQAFFPDWFTCVKTDALRIALLRAENLRVLRRAGRLENGLLRHAVCGQYAALAEGLNQLGREWQPVRPNPVLESRVWVVCTGLKLSAKSVQAVRQPDGSPEVTLQLKKARVGKGVVPVLEEQLSRLCACEMHCRTAQRDGLPLLYFAPVPPYRFRIGWAQTALQEVCGDVVEQLSGEKQRILLLCDGMGTGRTAALDARTTALFTARLMRAGLTADVAARMAEGVLLAREPGDRGSTLDVLTLQLTTGQASLYKAGACPSFLVRRGKVQQLGGDGTGLPLGGGTAPEAGRLTVQLQPQDWLFMVTDGVMAAGQQRLVQLLTRLAAILPADADPQQTAEGLLPLAVGDGVQDDCTLVAVRVEQRAGAQKPTP